MGAAPLSWLAKIGGDTLKTKAKLLSSAINELNELFDRTTKDITGSNSTTIFADDGSITVTYTDGTSVVTTFSTDGKVVTEKYYNGATLVSTKTTTFNADGSIKEETV